MPIVCESASDTKDDEIVDFAAIVRAVAEKMLVLIEASSHTAYLILYPTC